MEPTAKTSKAHDAGTFPGGPLPGHVSRTHRVLVGRYLRQRPWLREALSSAVPSVYNWFEIAARVEREAGLRGPMLLRLDYVEFAPL